MILLDLVCVALPVLFDLYLVVVKVSFSSVQCTLFDGHSCGTTSAFELEHQTHFVRNVCEHSPLTAAPTNTI